MILRLLQPSLNTVKVQSFEDESYVPMASPSPPITTTECDGYIPMSPRTFSFLNTNDLTESSTPLTALMGQPGELAPPPIHRHLKPRLRRGERPSHVDVFVTALFIFTLVLNLTAGVLVMCLALMKCLRGSDFLAR